VVGDVVLGIGEEVFLRPVFVEGGEDGSVEVEQPSRFERLGLAQGRRPLVVGPVVFDVEPPT
jgi:hypothetical protein